MKFICSLITVSDIAASKKFYIEILDQKISIDNGENVFFESGFAIHLSSHFSSLISHKTVQSGGNNFELYFEEEKVDELATKLQNLGVEFVHELREQPWRQRVVRFYDLDKNIIEVGESMEYLCFRLKSEGKSILEISNLINMDKDFVEKSIMQYA